MSLVSGLRLLFNCAFAVLVLLSSGISYADEYESDEADDETFDSAEQEPENLVQMAAREFSPSSSSAAREPAAVTGAVSPQNLEEILENHTQEMPSDSLGQTQVRTAASFGRSADEEPVSNSDINYGPAKGIDFDSVASLKVNSGYMRRGMEEHFGERSIANPNVLNLFEEYSHLRSEANAHLPSAFAPLISFIEEYIKANDKPESEETNGISHHKLAIQIVRASFCFGNDPFMMAAKMRRETNFTRTAVSPTGAVGFSQMTTIAVKEVQDQLSGNLDVSAPGAKKAYQEAIHCFSGIKNYELPNAPAFALKERVGLKWAFDMVLGQIHVKTLVSNAKAAEGYGNNTGGVVAAYEDAFADYNGDTQQTRGLCMGRASVQMRDEYACDVISHFNRMNAQWNRYVLRSTGKDLT